MDTDRLLERERELSQLGDLAVDVVGGSGRTILIEGPPGVGKSSLLTAGCRIAERHPRLRTGSFACGELEQELAWAAVIGLLSGPLSTLDAADRASVLSGPAATASRLFSVSDGSDESLPGGDIYSVIDALFALVAAIGERSPLILLLDDAHWADRPSLQFLVYLQRRLIGRPVGLVVATRPPELAVDRDLLERLAVAPATDVQNVGDLELSSVTEIIRAVGFPRAETSFCTACWEVTRGNPFYLLELLRELRDDRVDPDLGAEDLMRIPPPSVTRSVLVRLGRLPSRHAADLARATAILGDGASLRHVAAMAGVKLSDAALAVDALSAADLIEPEEPLRFVHPLVRAAVYTDIPPARRALQHARAAELLATEPAMTDHVALHLLHAPRVAAANTVRILREAAVRAVAKGAPEAAARFLRRALDEPPGQVVRAAVLIELAAAETAIGAPDAIVHLTEALDLARSPEERAQLYLRLGWAEHQGGRFERAADAFEAGAALDPEPELAHQLEAGFLMSATLVLSRAKAAQERLKAIEARPAAAQEVHHRQVLAQVLFSRTVTGSHRNGSIELARRLWDDGRMLDEDGPESEALWHIVGALSWADAYDESLTVIERVLERCDAQGFSLGRAQACYARSWPHLWMGRTDQAASDARAAIDIWQGGLERYLPAAIYYLGRAELDRGDVTSAQAALELAGPAERWEGTGMLPFLIGLQAHLHAAAGQPAEAAARHLACGAAIEALMVTSPAVFAWRSDAALAFQLTGEHDRARDLIDTELQMARGIGCPRPIGTGLRASGICRGGAQGLRELHESIEVLEGSGADRELALSLIALGTMLRRAGEPRVAREPLKRAIAVLQTSGAHGLIAQADTELRAAGGRGRERAKTGTDSLTASERRVADLAAAGHTNRHIASLLQISVKAVEWHLHQSYQKLRITGRRELTTVLDD